MACTSMSDVPETATLVDLAARGSLVALQGLPLLGARYRVLGMLGGGGMGNVYLAHDIELDENVAVKLLKASLSEGQEQIALLRREVKFARRVTHPNVLRTFDIGEHDGAKFITMELVDGGTLANILPSKLALSEVARIAHAICAGLGAAHDAGVVHRDLKPSNVMLASDGRILISDFGISQLADDTSDNGLAGTPGYMAPELIGGETVGASADVWALGAILYEMIAGARAFPYRAREDILRPLLEAAPDPAARRTEIPIALARVVTRCMARQPAARFAHPREISAALDAALPLPATSSSSAASRSATGSVRRSRVLAVLPLVNLAGAEEAHLAEGLTAILIDGIDSRDLRVPSRGAVEAASTPGRNPLEVGRDLGAEAIVTGSVAVASVVTGAGRLIAIELRVIGTGDGLVLYEERVNARLDEVVRAAEEASRSIARALLIERKDESTPLYESEVVDLYLHGRQQHRRRWEDSVDRSLSYFRRALALAPNDAMVLSAYALALARRLAFVGDEEVVKEALAVSTRALLAARDRPEPHLGRAAVAMQLADNVVAARALRVAAAIAPHHADVHYLLGILVLEVVGAVEAQGHFTTALMLDPSLTHAHWQVARSHALLGEWARCDALFATPPDDPANRADYWINRGRTVFYDPSPERLERFDADFAKAPWFDAREAIATAFAMLHGRRPSASDPSKLAALTKRKRGSKRRIAYVATMMAELSCAHGDLDEAVACLEEADAAGSVDIVWVDTCVLLGKLRERPEFKAIRDRFAARAAEVREALGAKTT